MSNKRTDNSWRKARNKDGIIAIPKNSRSTAAMTVKELLASEQMEISYLKKPWTAIFKAAFLWYLRFFALALLSFHLLIVGLVPIWIIFIYQFFYVFLKRLEKFGISKLKFGAFGVFVIVMEIVASHFIRELILLLYKMIFLHTGG